MLLLRCSTDVLTASAAGSTMARFNRCILRMSETGKMRGTVYCSKCGSLAEDGADFCPACGQQVQPSASPSKGLPLGASSSAALPAGYDTSLYPTASPTAPPVVYAQSSVQYAGFWLRVVAYLIDSV